jgi:hypothetical protein
MRTCEEKRLECCKQEMRDAMTVQSVTQLCHIRRGSASEERITGESDSSDIRLKAARRSCCSFDKGKCPPGSLWLPSSDQPAKVRRRIGYKLTCTRRRLEVPVAIAASMDERRDLVLYWNYSALYPVRLCRREYVSAPGLLYIHSL